MAVSKNARVAKIAGEKNNKVNIFYGSKPEWVKLELPFPEHNLNMYFENASSEPVVVCQDEKGFYITGKSFLTGRILDPYRLYHRFVPSSVDTSKLVEKATAE